MKRRSDHGGGSFRINTLSFLRNSQQSQSTSLICLSQGMVRSLESARETYHTYRTTGRRHNTTTTLRCGRVEQPRAFFILPLLTFGSFSASMLPRIIRQSFSNLCGVKKRFTIIHHQHSGREKCRDWRDQRRVSSQWRGEIKRHGMILPDKQTTLLCLFSTTNCSTFSAAESGTLNWRRLYVSNL